MKRARAEKKHARFSPMLLFSRKACRARGTALLDRARAQKTCSRDIIMWACALAYNFRGGDENYGQKLVMQLQAAMRGKKIVSTSEIQAARNL